MNFLKLLQKKEPAPKETPPPVDNAIERPDLEAACTQQSLCYWASRDVPHTQLRFLSVWTDRQSRQPVIGIKVVGTTGTQYWTYDSLPPGSGADPNVLRVHLEKLFAVNGAPNAPFFPGLPSMLQVADRSPLPYSTVKELVFLLMKNWDGADVRNFNEIILSKVSTEQALRRRLGREWMANWGDGHRRTIPVLPGDLDRWWAIVSETDRVPSEVTLCSKLEMQWQAMHNNGSRP